MITPPPLPATTVPNRHRTMLVAGLIGGVLLILLLAGYSVVHFVIATGITKGPDNMFGDQHLKTTVALLELYKVRCGKYPDKLSDLKFTGQWDQLALQSVDYRPNIEHTHYYVEVRRGWVGKPSLQMPDEFWQGTGYSSSLKPKSE